MDENDSLKDLAKARGGVGCCGSLIVNDLLDLSSQSQDWIKDFGRRLAESTKTPSWRRLQKAEIWIKDIMANIDIHIEDETKQRLMRANGRSCYFNTFGVPGNEGPSQEAVEGYLKKLEDAGSTFLREGEYTSFDYSWGKDHQSPQGLMLGDGNCLCPVVEDVKSDLSATYCSCSAGYVGEMFSRALGKRVEVDIIETLKTGADDCRFRIRIPNG